MDNINLGDLVRDKVSGFKGIVTSRTEFLNGCVRLGVTPTKLDKDNKPYTPEVVDEEQLELVKARAYKRPNVLDLVKEDTTSKKRANNPGGERYTPVTLPKR